MSMDDVYERAKVLERELGQFNNRLRASFNEVSHAHDRVAPLWQDTMRNEYEASWKPLDEAMQQYLNQIGPKYVDVLVDRLRYLNAYLHGHGA